MNKRLAQVNKHIQRTFGEILQTEADLPSDVMVTVARVDTTANLKSSTIWVYIFPFERAVEVMEILKPQMYDLQGSLNRALKFKPLPRIALRVDEGAQHAEDIEKTLDELKREKPGKSSTEL